MQTDTPNNPRPCIAHCIANTFDFAELRQSLELRYRVTAYQDALHIAQPGWEAYLFPYGVFVGWEMGYDEEQSLLETLRQHASDIHPAPFIDHFSFDFHADRTRIRNDHIELATTDSLEQLAVSHGLAQSVKLMEFEDQARRSIEETRYIPENIARYGRANLRRKEIAKLRGMLYIVRSDIHLHFDLLDTPEFFWEYPELQETYRNIINYLEVEQRTRLLNDKLNIIQQLLNMLAEEQKHKHSSTLEWIIIWLIAVEIVIFMAHDILHLV